MSEREEFSFERVRLWWPGKREGEEFEVSDQEVEALRRELSESAERKGIRMTYRTPEEIDAGIFPGHAGRPTRKEPKKRSPSKDGAAFLLSEGNDGE